MRLRQPRVLRELVGQSGELLDLRQRRREVLARAGALRLGHRRGRALEELQRELQRREDVLELVGQLAGRTPPGGLALGLGHGVAGVLQPGGHGVERPADVAQLAGAARLHAGRQVTGGHAVEGPGQLGQRSGDGAGQQMGEQQGQQHERHHQPADQQRDQRALHVHHHAQAAVGAARLADLLDVGEEVRGHAQSDDERVQAVAPRDRREQAAARSHHAVAGQRRVQLVADVRRGDPVAGSGRRDRDRASAPPVRPVALVELEDVEAVAGQSRGEVVVGNDRVRRRPGVQQRGRPGARRRLEPLQRRVAHPPARLERAIHPGTEPALRGTVELDHAEDGEDRGGQQRHQQQCGDEARAKAHAPSLPPASCPQAAPMSPPCVRRTVTAGARG